LNARTSDSRSQRSDQAELHPVMPPYPTSAARTAQLFSPCSRPAGARVFSCISSGIVELAGFEPAASCTQSTRASQAAPQPVVGHCQMPRRRKRKQGPRTPGEILPLYFSCRRRRSPPARSCCGLKPRRLGQPPPGRQSPENAATGPVEPTVIETVTSALQVRCSAS
jgi:hypothetical protein